MSDFITMKERIAREMKRGEITATSQAVEGAILSAIKYWEVKTFWFNEVVDMTISTTTNQRTVDISSTSIYSITSLKVFIGNRDYPISKKSYEWIDAIDQGQWEGYPQFWAWFEKDTLRLYPIPNAVYSMSISGKQKFPVLVEDTDTNVWMVEGEEMVRNWAKGLLFTDELRSPKLADVFFGRSMQEYKPLLNQTNQQATTGVVPTQF